MSFPPGTKMFQFPGFAFPVLWIQTGNTLKALQQHPKAPLAGQGGFPHSEIRGSKPILGSPRLIAEYHVLHRLLLPRHPPNALFALDPIQKKPGFSRNGSRHSGFRTSRPRSPTFPCCPRDSRPGAQRGQCVLDLERLQAHGRPVNRTGRPDAGTRPGRNQATPRWPARPGRRAADNPESGFAHRLASRVFSLNDVKVSVTGRKNKGIRNCVRPAAIEARLETSRQFSLAATLRNGMVEPIGIEPTTS